LLLAVEFVSDAKTRTPFPAEAHIATRVQADALEAGVMTYPIQGAADGTRGDHILIAPPFTITTPMIELLAGAMDKAASELEKLHTARMGGDPARA
jgi:hypothetical protein